MFRFGAIAAAAGLLGVSSVAASEERPGYVRVPVAPPTIRIFANEEELNPSVERPVEPADEIFLSVEPGTAYFESEPPSDVDEAIEVLREALPEDYMQMLMEDWGYERVDWQRVETSRSGLREVDLARFLFDRWVERNPDGQLAKEFSCLSWGEFSIGPFLTLLTHAEASDHEWENQEHFRLRYGLRDTRLARHAIGSAYLVLSRCRDLIEQD